MRRSEQLMAIAKEFCRVHDEWAADENRPVPDEPYWDASDAMIASFAAGDTPGDCRALAEAVEVYAKAADDFDNRDDPRDAYPPDDFWTAREAVARVLAGSEKQRQELTPLESIATLKSQGVTDLQIAKIYGFRDRNGEWMPRLVQKEFDSPGSVLKTAGAVDGRDWRDPRLPAGDSGNAVVEKHVAELAAKRRRARKGEAACPETPKELWEQGVSVKQSAKMLRLDESEVAAMFQGFDDEREAAILSGQAVDPTTRAIREMAAAGKSVKQIVAELKVDPKTVADAMKGVGVASGGAEKAAEKSAAATVGA